MRKIFSFVLVFAISLIIGNSSLAANTTTKPIANKPVVVATESAIQVKPLDLVANPTKYLHKRVKIRAKFDKFSTLGLDYHPAYKSSEDYITFLIKRDDVVNYVVPLSELKNFMTRKTAEQYIDLKPGDEIEYTGTVFSNALSDTWLEVDSFKVLNEVFKEKVPSVK